VEKSLARLGRLAPGCDPEVRKVVQAQKEEIRLLAQRAEAAERRVQVLKLGNEYTEGKAADVDVSRDLLDEAIEAVRDIQSSAYQVKRKQMQRELDDERAKMPAIPTEKELEKATAEYERIKEEHERALNIVQRYTALSERSCDLAKTRRREGYTTDDSSEDDFGEDVYKAPQALSSKGGASGENPESSREAAQAGEHPMRGRRRSAIPVLPIEPDEGPATKASLTDDIAELNGEIDKLKKRISGAETITRNGEETLKVLEESKAIFLEHIARVKPSILGFKTDDDEDETEELEETDELLLAMAELGSEERRLRAEIEALEARFEWRTTEVHDHQLDGKDLSASLLDLKGRVEHAEKSQKLTDAEDAELLQKQAEKIKSTMAEGEVSDAVVAADEVAAPADGSIESPQVSAGSQIKPPEANATTDAPTTEAEEGTAEAVGPSDGAAGAAAEGQVTEDGNEENEDFLSPEEEACEKLRSMRHDEIRKLLRAHVETKELESEVKEMHQKLQKIKMERGEPEDVSKLTAEDAEKYDVPPELITEVQRKHRELCALKKLWWSARQDPQTTVRRSKALLELKVVDGVERPQIVEEDMPSLFQQVLSSTMPI